MYRAKANDGSEVVVISPSDLVSFLSCRHKTALDLAVASGSRAKPEVEDSSTTVLQRRGLEHEAQYLTALRSEGLEVEDIALPAAADPDSTTPDGPVERADALYGLRGDAARTREAIAAGVDVVFQGTFLDDSDPGVWWRGHADFLRRKTRADSTTGRPAYEPEDTKLARHVKPGAVVQLAVYAELLAQVQGVAPAEVHVVLGGHSTVSVPLREVGAYERLARRRLEEAVETGLGATYPDRVEHCGVCRWDAVCSEQRRTDDHLSLVAGLGGQQVRRLSAAGVTTIAALGAQATQGRYTARPPGMKGMGADTFDRLAHQARLQVAARQAPDEPPPFELLEPSGADRGLEALPPPSQGDLYFDIEGDPFVEGGGLEYLFGIGWHDEHGDFEFQPFWGLDRKGEKQAFEQLMDFISERLAVDPELHVYHYAPYEPSALGKLAGRHATREDEVDELLRRKVLVDLYRVVRQSIRVGSESYSIKKLEPLYMPARDDAITDAGSSIVEFERWLATNEPQILEDIENYNQVDCASTALLHRWLEQQRTALEMQAETGLDRQVPPPIRPDEATNPEGATATTPLEDALRMLASRLVPPPPPAEDMTPSAPGTEPFAPGAPPAVRPAEPSTPESAAPTDDGSDDEGATDARWLLAQLLDYYQREDKPAWWRFFDRVEGYLPGDLIDDPDCIDELTYEGVVGTVKQSELHLYRFDPDQEYKIDVGTPVWDPTAKRFEVETGKKAPKVGDVVELDPREGTVTLKRGKNSKAGHTTGLIPDEVVQTGALKIAIQTVAEWVADNAVDGPGPYRAIRDLLARTPPRITGTALGEPLRREGEGTREAASRLIQGLDFSYMPVQGPPGTGKTFTAGHVIVDLIAAGKTVGITANSHSVVANLLKGVIETADQRGVDVRAMQKPRTAAGGLDHPSVTVVDDNKPIEAAIQDGVVDLVAGTAWLFARDAIDQKLDYLFIDEAGQLALANVVAAARAAHNLVLVGDPQQLAQPSTGTHPPGVGAAGLEHILDGAATILANQGLFLDTTYRMHPAITSYISELAYDERLGADESCTQQRIVGNGPLSGSGVRWVPVQHTGNRTSSEEEAVKVRELYDELLGMQWVDQHGTTRDMTAEDVRIVAPYNVQVHVLAQHLPTDALIGTVDKFQGQEGAVVLVSLAASSTEEIPRGMEFLYSTNRLNVAVSRARALAVVVASPVLLEPECRSVAQLRLVNGLCRFAELGGA